MPPVGNVAAQAEKAPAPPAKNVGGKKTIEERLKQKQAEIAARLAAIEGRKKSAEREKNARLDRIIGAACRADETMRDAINAALSRNTKAPKDREFLKVEGWLQSR